MLMEGDCLEFGMWYDMGRVNNMRVPCLCGRELCPGATVYQQRCWDFHHTEPIENHYIRQRAMPR
jgi:hypothetical protein